MAECLKLYHGVDHNTTHQCDGVMVYLLYTETILLRIGPLKYWNICVDTVGIILSSEYTQCA